MITCIACCVQRRAAMDGATPDAVALSVLIVARRHQLTIEDFCRGLCDEHTQIFKGGVIAAGAVEKGLNAKCDN